MGSSAGEPDDGSDPLDPREWSDDAQAAAARPAAPAPALATPDAQRSFVGPAAEVDGVVPDVAETARLLRTGSWDPTVRLWPGAVALAAHTPEGPATLRVRRVPAASVPSHDAAAPLVARTHAGDHDNRNGDAPALLAEAWGDGAAWALQRAAAVAGLLDPFPTRTWAADVIGPIARRRRTLRIGQGLTVLPTAIAVALQQRVTFGEAAAAWRRLTRQYSRPAPGPDGLWLPLDGPTLAGLGLARLEAHGVDPQRGRTVLRLATHHRKLERLLATPLADADARLRAFEGVGPWTSGLVRALALGDPDGVPVGDAELPKLTAWALAGEPQGDDRRMLELLAPYRGQRWRVLRLLYAEGFRAPRFVPRLMSKTRTDRGRP